MEGLLWVWTGNSLQIIHWNGVGEALEKYLDNLPNDLTVPSWCNKKAKILAEISDLWREQPLWSDSAVLIFLECNLDCKDKCTKEFIAKITLKKKKKQVNFQWTKLFF